jgi:cytochrome c
MPTACPCWILKKGYEIKKEGYMKKVLLFTVLFCIVLPFIATAGEVSKKRQAQENVTRAIAYVKEVGTEKAFAEFNNPRGKFTHNELYIFAYDASGRILAHGQFAKWIGKTPPEINITTHTVAVAKILKIAKDPGKGWIDYDYTNSVNGKTEHKQSYIEKSGDVIVGCGVYSK